MNSLPNNFGKPDVVNDADQSISSVSFCLSGSGLLSNEMTQRALGTGVAVSQSNGNLVVTTGTSTNAEFLARSKVAFDGAWLARVKTILSQRITNNNFLVMLADSIAESAICTINSATSITVSLPGHSFTAQNVGQFMFIGAIVGAAGVPGRYAIASVANDTINFTVAGWPASGTCVVDVFGWNYVKTGYSGTTATNAAIDAQRMGWASGDTTATINTTASPGHVMQMQNDGRDIYFADTLVASTATPAATARGSRFENIPDDGVSLYLYLWSYNGTSAPASTTTWTTGFWSVETYPNKGVFINGMRLVGGASLPVNQAASGGSPVVTPFTPTESFINSAATTNATSIKASAGTVYGIVASNAGAAAAFVKFYNKASAPTVGTDVPVFTICLNASATLNLDMGALGHRFSTGIALAITNLVADTDTTAVAAAQVKVATAYI